MFNDCIDYTLLKIGTTKSQIIELCETAKKHGYKSVCVPPCYIKTAVNELWGSKVLTCGVVSFPMGMCSLEMKTAETLQQIAEGAKEIDVVMNLGAFKSGNLTLIKDELTELRFVTKERGAVLKYIIETGALNLDEINSLCQIANMVGLDFLKTSTGFYNPGAELEKVQFIRKHLAPSISIKASGGIRTTEQALSFLKAGASRIGTSSIIQFESLLG